VVSATSSTRTRWNRRLALQFLAPTLVALLGALLTAVPYFAWTVERHQVETLAERLFAEARLAGEALPWSSGEALDAACARLGADLGTRITVIAPDGRVLGESTRPSSELENHATDPRSAPRSRPERASGSAGARRSARGCSTQPGGRRAATT